MSGIFSSLRRSSKEDVLQHGRRASKSGLAESELDRRVTVAQARALKATKGTIKLLILGAGGSGKSACAAVRRPRPATDAPPPPATLRKQFTRLYAHGFEDVASRAELRDVIVYNLVEGARVVIEAAKAPGIGGGIRSEAALAATEKLAALPKDACTLDPELAAALKALANDEVIQATLLMRSRYQLQECFLPYFASVLTYPEWGGPNWVPSVDDCVRSRVRSSGIIEVSFELDGQKFKVFDAGGQRAERRKWLHAFDDVTAWVRPGPSRPRRAD